MGAKQNAALVKPKPYNKAGYSDNYSIQGTYPDKETTRYPVLPQFMAISNSNGLLRETDIGQREKCPVIPQGTYNK
jgi:hypothetical protein